MSRMSSFMSFYSFFFADNNRNKNILSAIITCGGGSVQPYY